MEQSGKNFKNICINVHIYLMKLEKGNNLQRMLKTVFIFANIYHRNYQRKEQEITKKTKESIWSECKHVFVYIYILKLQKVE